MTTVFFLRHGPTVENKEGRVQGQHPGTLLVPDTEHYISGIVPLLREERIDLLLSSDLTRAIDTLAILKRFLLQPDILEGQSPLLREKAMGLYEGMLWSEVPPEFREQRNHDQYDFRSFGGENDSDVRERVRKMLREFSLKYPNKRICCVTHAGWLEQLVKIADSEGILPNQWSDRKAIYEAGVGSMGQLQYFHALNIEASVSLDDE